MNIIKWFSGIFNYQFAVPFFALVGVLITSYFSQKAVQKQMRSIYDKESDWTSHLVDVMEKQTKCMGEKEILIVKRALRIYRNNDVRPLNIRKIWIFQKIQFSKLYNNRFYSLNKKAQRIRKFGLLWNFMTDMSISYLIELLTNAEKDELEEKEAENVRLIAQTLFSNRWEYTQRLSNKQLPRIARNKLGPIFVKTTLNLVLDKKEILSSYVPYNEDIGYFKNLFADAIIYYETEEYRHVIKTLEENRVI